GQNPLVLDSGMSAQVAAHESQTHTRYAGISLILGLEHGGEGRRFEHCSVLVAAAAKQSGYVASHVPGGGVDRPRGRGHKLAVGDRLRATRTELVSGCEARLDVFGPQEVGVGHPERLEDVIAKVAVEGLPAHVLDDLSERR